MSEPVIVVSLTACAVGLFGTLAFFLADSLGGEEKKPGYSWADIVVCAVIAGLVEIEIALHAPLRWLRRQLERLLSRYARAELAMIRARRRGHP